jgi:hypothetical protein
MNDSLGGILIRVGRRGSHGTSSDAPPNVASRKVKTLHSQRYPRLSVRKVASNRIPQGALKLTAFFAVRSECLIQLHTCELVCLHI